MYVSKHFWLIFCSQCFSHCELTLAGQVCIIVLLALTWGSVLWANAQSVDFTCILKLLLSSYNIFCLFDPGGRRRFLTLLSALNFNRWWSTISKGFIKSLNTYLTHYEVRKVSGYLTSYCHDLLSVQLLFQTPTRYYP